MFNFTPKAYLIHYPNVIQRKAFKTYTCEVCGCEIVKGDYYYSYKPYPINDVWYGWRKRCLDHKPNNYNEVFIYEDENATTIQSKRFNLKIKI